jgi:hypothetical protein
MNESIIREHLALVRRALGAWPGPRSVGKVLKPLAREDDLLEEMLEPDH